MKSAIKYVALLALIALMGAGGCATPASKESGSFTCPSTATKACTWQGKEVAPGATVSWDNEITDGSRFYSMVTSFEKARKPLVRLSGASKVEIKAAAGKEIKLTFYQARTDWPVRHQWTDQRWKYGAAIVSQAGAVVTAGLGFYFGYKTVDSLVNGSGGFGRGATTVNNSGQGQINVGGGVNTGPVSGPAGGSGGSVGPEGSSGTGGAGGSINP